MATPPLSKDIQEETLALVEQAIKEGFVVRGSPSAITEGWRRWNKKYPKNKTTRTTFVSRYERATRATASPRAQEIKNMELVLEQTAQTLRKSPKRLADIASTLNCSMGEILDAVNLLTERGVRITRTGDIFGIPEAQPASWVHGPVIELVSDKNNRFCFGAFGDLHAASKYARWDVREKLVRETENSGATCIFDTGNWIDGEARFNQHDLETHGLDNQLRYLARNHPKTKLPIYAVTGDDHEGWYAAKEGIDVGNICEMRMREAGHNWHDLGYMEAHIVLKNANTGATATMAVVHPGGGSAYALSYSIQKIVESYEGGEKPAVGLYGHYHKIWAGTIRNVWVVQTGCQQDQTPFMRKKRLEAHVGGAIVTLEQDPGTGAIVGMTPRLLRYFNKGWHGGGNRWSRHGDIILPARDVK